MQETWIQSQHQKDPLKNKRPLQYFCLEDPWTEEPGGAIVHWVAKALDTTQQLNDGNNEYYINTNYAAAYLNGFLLLKHNFQFNLQCENKSY